MKFVLAVAVLFISSLGLRPALAQSLKPGSVFRDCPTCPEMVVIPPGSFIMGEAGFSRRMPLHKVTINHLFAVGRFDVTFEEWDACVADGSCSGYRPADHGWGRGRRPVINVSWEEAQGYVLWLSKKTGRHYRLLSEAEFEYVARAGTTTTFWWGNDAGEGHANCRGCGGEWAGRQTSPVGSFKPNAFGVYDTAGNVTEWVEDRWNRTYDGAPTDGSAWETGDPRRRVMRSGSWYNGPGDQHSSFRNAEAPRARNIKIGFRVATTLH
jgi:formylglycine-generating enzyme required for sulfatase activity